MKVMASYLLAVLGGNASPSADDLKDILSSIGLLLTQVTGITELIAARREKLASVPAGGGAVAVACAGASATSGATGGAAALVEAEPKKEEKVEEKEGSDDDMGFSLFDQKVAI
ncbi:60S acidic ribosomal protein P2-4 [Forsythia ovata]